MAWTRTNWKTNWSNAQEKKVLKYKPRAGEIRPTKPMDMKQIWNDIKERWPVAALGAIFALITALIW